MLRYIIRNLRFFFKDISKNILKALFSSFGIIFLIAFLVIYISLRQSVSRYIGDTLFGSMDINEIIIHPKTGGGRDVIVSGENTIRRPTAAQIRGMKDFSSVYSLIKMDHVTRIETSVVGQDQTIRIPLYGIEQGFFQNRNPRWASFTNKVPLPLVIPKYSLQFLNSYLSQEGFPQFTESALVGYPGMLSVSVNNSEDSRERFKTPLALHSLSDAIDFPGVVVPSAFIINFAKVHRMDSGKPIEGYSYVRMYAKVKDVKQLPRVTDTLKKMGLRVESQSDISKKTNKAMAVVDGIFLLLGVVVLVLTVISIFNSYLVIAYDSSYEISLKRVIGLSKLRVIFSFVFEAALIGAFLGVIGYFLGHYLIGLLASQIAGWIPAFKELIITRPEESYLHYAVLFSVAVSAFSALIPAVFASNKNLFKTMAQ
ncbi:MAG: ABC transporter permease [Spirochaetia bacterium]|jgi:ABC-type lipoprotein release transport system permease subunit|nr:ABC transporter permease [Spirochaetia bacterium]